MHEANIINIELKDIHIKIILFIDYLCYFISLDSIFIAQTLCPRTLYKIKSKFSNEKLIEGVFNNNFMLIKIHYF